MSLITYPNVKTMQPEASNFFFDIDCLPGEVEPWWWSMKSWPEHTQTGQGGQGGQACQPLPVHLEEGGYINTLKSRQEKVA